MISRMRTYRHKRNAAQSNALFIKQMLLLLGISLSFALLTIILWNSLVLTGITTQSQLIIPYDYWKTPYNIGNNQLISAGPDKHFQTADDFTLYLNKPLLENLLRLPLMTVIQEFWLEKTVLSLGFFLFIFWYTDKNGSVSIKSCLWRIFCIGIFYITISYEFHMIYIMFETYQLYH